MDQKQPIILSIKPQYADLIFEGLKKAELRRRILLSMENREVFVYVSRPVKQLRGGFRVAQLSSGTPNEIWDKVSEYSAIDKQSFDNYYRSCLKAYALHIDEVWEYENPVNLDVLREKCTDFFAPQSWRYAKPCEHKLFSRMKIKRKSLAA